MELKEFISQALIQIVDGVRIAQKHAEDKGAIISPGWETNVARASGEIDDYNFSWQEQIIEFDVATTASEGTEGKAGAGLFVAGLTLGDQARGETFNQTLSRLKFTVPVYLPSQAKVQT